MKVLRETEVSLAFDGGNNVGMLARRRRSRKVRPTALRSFR
jgi:hypothetical protein